MPADYLDIQLIEHLEFGWPLVYAVPVAPIPTYVNHASDEDVLAHIVPFVEKECEFGGHVESIQ